MKTLSTSPYDIVFGLPVNNLLLTPKDLLKLAQCYFRTTKPQFGVLRETVQQNQLKLHQDTKGYMTVDTVKTSTFKVSDRVWFNEPKPSKVKLRHKVQKKIHRAILNFEAVP